MGITEQGQEIERTLNKVKTLGQARAAVRAGIQSLDRMLADVAPFWQWITGIEAAKYVHDKVVVGGPSTDTAIREELTVYRAALAAELRTIAGDDADLVGPSWERTHRQLTRSYIAIAGAEGARSARPDLLWHLENLQEAIGDAAKMLAPFAISGAIIALVFLAWYLGLAKGRK